ncbi:MAG: FHA domain-containing protein [SAR202 cluster bacterium]|jgi:hypothetical protein|nr:hypothetical protein [Chloroflexota bacterium]MDP6422657.1 FHA domain-containing protein [SAR202 cluster bacterium]HAL48104.1 hypothetical protein [Dehalococcoidia bacterium]MDP6801018.1 FHA domain-containing protein [SAR202 cluster bacterium]MQG59195.1 FHA domain-containing protein [SAR202 cluster bacterium]|tara:strand:- start:704 stop:1312 length:609 start_codon:yes stop_codon:yes gene_type:complete
MNMSSRSKLRVRGGPFDGCGVSLAAAITTMGRDATNDIVEEHPAVSRKHARIFRNPQGFWIQDVGSANGTFIDGEKIGQEPHSLKNGDRIQLGSAASGTDWEFFEEEVVGLGVAAPPTMQLSVSEAAGGTTPGAILDSEGESVCELFRRNNDGSWTCKRFASFDAHGQQIEVSRNTVFAPGIEFLGFDLAMWLEEICAKADE